MFQDLFPLTRWLCAFSGLVLILLALFLYETENRKLQTFFEKLWIRMDDLRTAGISKHASFMRVVANSVSSALDRLLGSRLFSVRLVAVSFCYSLASVGLVFWFISVLAGGTQGLLSIGGCFFLAGFLYGTVPIKLQKSSHLWIWSSPLILVALMLFLFFLGGPGRRYLLWLFFGVLSCAAFLALTKIVFSWISQVRSFGSIIGILVVNCLPLALLVLLYYATFGWHSVGRFGSTTESLSEPILYSAVMSAIPAVVSLIFVLLSLTLLVHRAVWRSLQSPIYALQEAGIERRKKIFGYVGGSLIGISGVSAIKPLANFLADLIK